tara:strand:- start:203 stop:526 length:324 start_codon:yes stop_codon:yes gene_type:complete
MDRTNNLIANWRNKEKTERWKRNLGAAYAEKNAKFKGVITREEIDTATDEFLASGGQIKKLEAQDDVWMQKDDLAFEIEMSKLRRSLRIQLTDLQARDIEFIKMEAA